MVLEGAIFPGSHAILSLDHLSRTQQVLKDPHGLRALQDGIGACCQSVQGREGERACVPMRRCLFSKRQISKKPVKVYR